MALRCLLRRIVPAGGGAPRSMSTVQGGGEQIISELQMKKMIDEAVRRNLDERNRRAIQDFSGIALPVLTAVVYTAVGVSGTILYQKFQDLNRISTSK